MQMTYLINNSITSNTYDSWKKYNLYKLIKP